MQELNLIIEIINLCCVALFCFVNCLFVVAVVVVVKSVLSQTYRQVHPRLAALCCTLVAHVVIIFIMFVLSLTIRLLQSIFRSDMSWVH